MDKTYPEIPDRKNMRKNIGRMVIIGAKGKMGRLFFEKALTCDFDVVGLEQPLRTSELEQVIPGAGIVLMMVPIPALSEVLDKIIPYLDGKSILADICSVKIKPLKSMLEAYSGPVVGTHPLFGPQPEPGLELKVCLCRGRDNSAFSKVSELFRCLGMVPSEADPSEHDQAMSYIQGLNFVTTLAYLALQPKGVELEQYLTPSFERRLQAAKKMITQDAGLFEILFDSNPHSAQTVREFRSFLNVAASGELELLAQKAQWWWRKQDIEENP